MFKRLIGVLAVVLGCVALAQPALAVTWFSSSAPLKVYQDGITQGSAYGDFKNNSGVSARSYSWQKDAKPGGDGIYVETAFYFWDSCDTSASYCYSDTKSTTNTTSGAWVADYTAKYLQAGATSARGKMKICENHSWAKDPCSATVIRSFSY
ncbi:MAG: hypothetical protein ACJ72D_26560 [Marmoricola sp.]